MTPGRNLDKYISCSKGVLHAAIYRLGDLVPEIHPTAFVHPAAVVVGHNAHLEGAVVEGRCLIGSMSTCLQRVVVGTGSLVGAAALLTEGTVVPPRSRALGVPEGVAPHQNPDEFADGLRWGVATYDANAARCLSEMERIG